MGKCTMKPPTAEREIALSVPISEGLLKGGLPRRVVAASGAHLQPGLVRKDFHRAETSVGLEIGRLIAKHIFTAQRPLDFSEGT